MNIPEQGLALIPLEPVTAVDIENTSVGTNAVIVTAQPKGPLLP